MNKFSGIFMCGLEFFNKAKLIYSIVLSTQFMSEQTHEFGEYLYFQISVLYMRGAIELKCI